MIFHNYAQFWCSVMVEGLIKRGVDHFFIGPGSRSTPLVSALVRNKKAQVFVGMDERSIAFMALGYGKGSQRPGAVVTTSGTAVANLYPAVVEAFLSETPMLLLTADRPYELRDCGANQTIFQAQMFHHHVNKSFDLAPPSPLVSLDLSWAIFDRSLSAALQPKSGPVHINLQFREPLANLPHPGEEAFQASYPFDHGDVALNSSFEQLGPHLPPAIFSSPRGLLAVGEMKPGEAIKQILLLAEKIDWPIFADVTSNLRLCQHKNILHHFDLALLNEGFVKDFAPEVVVKLGGPIVSKRFWDWLKHYPRSKLLSISQSGPIDPVGRLIHQPVQDLGQWLECINGKLVPRPKSAWFDIPAYRSIGHHIDNFLEISSDNEAYFSAKLVASIDQPVDLFLSSSMPIRYIDQFTKPNPIPIHVYTNRGASGIDGITSSALGVAVANKKPTIALLGDVAFIHDTNGLMLLKQASLPILLVVLNNSGGGIFHLLPIAQEKEVITPWIDTPHDVSLKQLCLAHGLAHRCVKDGPGFIDAIRHFFREPSTAVLEVAVNRDENICLYKALCDGIKNIKD